MTRRVEMRPSVPADIPEAVAFLDRQSAGRGDRFATLLVETLDWLAEHAEAGSPKTFTDARLIDLRSWPVRQFDRYLIFYGLHPDRIEVFGVVYGTRDLEAVLRVRV